MKGFRVWGLGFSRIIALFFALFVFLYPIPYTLYPVRAFNIGEKFGFGSFTSLGGVISTAVPAIFSVAAALVVIYFLWGSFKFLTSGGDKEAVAGARGMITHAIIGFIILMFTFLILQFLLFSLFGITGFQLFQS